MPLLKLKKDIDKEKTAEKISEKIYKYLLDNNIQNKLNKKIQKLKEIGENEIAEEYKASLDTLIDVLDEIVENFKDEKISIETYKEILKIGLKNKKIGKIPQNLDQVILGDIDRTKSHKIKVAFITSINDGIFPSINKNEGFFNDNDREILKEKDLEIANGTLDNLYEEQFNTYKVLTLAEEKLYLSYTSSNKDGGTLRPSVIISKIKKIFPQIHEESDIIIQKSNITNQKATYIELLKNIRKFKNGEKIENVWIEIYNWYIQNEYWKNKLKDDLKGLEYSNDAERLKKENIEKLYGNDFKTSISRLEQYRKCPFSFHLTYGLKLQEEKKYEISSIDTGSFMHDIIDTFFDRIDNLEIEDEKIEKIIEEIINEKLKLEKNYIFTNSPKFVLLTNRLKKTVKDSIKYIVYQLRNSDFKVAGHEMDFDKKVGNIEL